jgi:hypothetical protein
MLTLSHCKRSCGGLSTHFLCKRIKYYNFFTHKLGRNSCLGSDVMVVDRGHRIWKWRYAEIAEGLNQSKSQAYRESSTYNRKKNEMERWPS